MAIYTERTPININYQIDDTNKMNVYFDQTPILKINSIYNNKYQYVSNSNYRSNNKNMNMN